MALGGERGTGGEDPSTPRAPWPGPCHPPSRTVPSLSPPEAPQQGPCHPNTMARTLSPVQAPQLSPCHPQTHPGPHHPPKHHDWSLVTPRNTPLGPLPAPRTGHSPTAQGGQGVPGGSCGAGGSHGTGGGPFPNPAAAGRTSCRAGGRRSPAAAAAATSPSAAPRTPQKVPAAPPATPQLVPPAVPPPAAPLALGDKPPRSQNAAWPRRDEQGLTQRR